MAIWWNKVLTKEIGRNVVVWLARFRFLYLIVSLARMILLRKEKVTTMNASSVANDFPRSGNLSVIQLFTRGWDPSFVPTVPSLTPRETILRSTSRRFIQSILCQVMRTWERWCTLPTPRPTSTLPSPCLTNHSPALHPLNQSEQGWASAL